MNNSVGLGPSIGEGKSQPMDGGAGAYPAEIRNDDLFAPRWFPLVQSGLLPRLGAGRVARPAPRAMPINV